MVGIVFGMPSDSMDLRIFFCLFDVSVPCTSAFVKLLCSIFDEKNVNSSLDEIETNIWSRIFLLSNGRDINKISKKMPPFFPGTIVLLVVIMFSFGLTLSMRSFQFEQLIRKDDRLRRIMEAVTHLKIIKLMNWEETFDNQVDELRAKELASIRMFLTLQVRTQCGKTRNSLTTKKSLMKSSIHCFHKVFVRKCKSKFS